MNIYEIDAAIADLVDQETGEILNYEAFASLALARETKIENMALAYKNFDAEAKAIKQEIANLTNRQKTAENNAARLKGYLLELTGGEKFKTPRVNLYFGTSTSVAFTDEAEFVRKMEASGQYDFLKFKAPEIDRTAVKNAINAGQTVEGAELAKSKYIVIK